MTAGATGELYINRGATAWPMAKRKYSTMKRNKIEPSVLTINLNTPIVNVGSLGEFTCDLSQMASIVNRRFYRQGINWAVAGVKVTVPGRDPGTGTVDGTVRVLKLPNTWIMSNAWEKSMRVWNRMNREALAESESVRPRFLDFKIYADAKHHTDGYVGNLLPLTSALPIGTTYTPGEWEASKASIPVTPPAGAFLPGETVEREFIATGPSYPGASAVTGFDALSLIEGYAASRGLPNILDPNTPDDVSDVGGGTPENWMQAIFNEGTLQVSDVLEDMITENNIAPYPFENDGVHLDTMYPGGANQAPGLELHDYSSVSGTTIGNQTRLKGGNFPCGLMRFEWAPSTIASGIQIQIDLMPGTHRGYLCEPMTEM